MIVLREAIWSTSSARFAVPVRGALCVAVWLPCVRFALLVSWPFSSGLVLSCPKFPTDSEQIASPADFTGRNRLLVFFWRRDNILQRWRRVSMMWGGNQVELATKEANLIAAIETMLPDFARACRAPDLPIVIMHQDAFAADYQEEEFRLLGMAIKFAGICGKDVHIAGSNRETMDQSQSTH